MIRHYSFYSQADGALVDGVFGTTDPAAVEANIPQGLKLIEGRFDHLSQRVNLTTGAIEDYQPAQPSPDHEWNADARRWRVNSAAQAKLDAKQSAQAEIARLEKDVQPRAQREMALGQAGALERLAALDGQIATLRQAL